MTSFQTIVNGQTNNLFYFQANIGDIYKKDTAGTYFYLTTYESGFKTVDKTKIVYISKDLKLYKFSDINGRIYAEGGIIGKYLKDFFSSGYMLQNEKWTEYYDNGKIKLKGNYYKGNPIGLWQLYYANGQLKESYSFSRIETDSLKGNCKTGIYQEFYENGKIKTFGNYKAFVDTVFYPVEDENGNTYPKAFKKFKERKFGVWTYYKETGEIEKQEEFD